MPTFIEHVISLLLQELIAKSLEKGTTLPFDMSDVKSALLMANRLHLLSPDSHSEILNVIDNPEWAFFDHLVGVPSTNQSSSDPSVSI